MEKMPCGVEDALNIGRNYGVYLSKLKGIKNISPFPIPDKAYSDTYIEKLASKQFKEISGKIFPVKSKSSVDIDERLGLFNAALIAGEIARDNEPKLENSLYGLVMPYLITKIAASKISFSHSDSSASKNEVAHSIGRAKTAAAELEMFSKDPRRHSLTLDELDAHKMVIVATGISDVLFDRYNNKSGNAEISEGIKKIYAKKMTVDQLIDRYQATFDSASVVRVLSHNKTTLDMRPR